MRGLVYDLALALPERLGLARLRAGLLGDLTGRVLEVGAGTGLNSRAAKGAQTLIQTEPELSDLLRARGRPAIAGVRRLYVVAAAEALPFAAGAFDAAFATLVLCSAVDPALAAREMRRVVRPGGPLRLLEHVRSPVKLVARLQTALTPAWSHVEVGCHLDRDPRDAYWPAGWSDVHDVRLAGSLVARIEAVA